MKSICIIPARAGSKRFPHKNISEFMGTPLICHTIMGAIGFFDEIIVSSDSQKILDICKFNLYNEQNIKFDLRPSILAKDDSKVIDTVSWYFDKNTSDQIWLMLPTCPLRSRTDIQSAKNILTNTIDGVISITEYEFPPDLSLEIIGKNRIMGHQHTHWVDGNSRSQDHKKLYRPNGAIYGMWSVKFDQYRNFYKGNVVGYYMPRERSIDIDIPLDIKIAEALCKQG